MDIAPIEVRLRKTSRAADASKALADDDRAARDAVIVEAEAAGWSQRQIATATGMAQSSVAWLLGQRAKAGDR